VGTEEIVEELTCQLRGQLKKANEAAAKETDLLIKHVLTGYAAGLAYAIVRAESIKRLRSD